MTPSTQNSPFPVRRTVTMEGPRTVHKTVSALSEADIRIDEGALELLKHEEEQEASAEEDLDLCFVSLSELGFSEGATQGEIYGRAAELGLEVCPAAVGPLLRLKYQDQPVDEVLLIAMKPVPMNRTQSILTVARDTRGPYLAARIGFPGYYWRPGDMRFVFVSSNRQ